MNKINLLFAILLSSQVLQAQETRFFMPLDIKKAYDNGTRSYDGKPGEKYWQITVDYLIDASIDPPTRTLTGSETVTLYNNSPAALNSIVIRLYNDIYKKGNIRLEPINLADLSDTGVDIKEFSINDEAYNLSDQQIARRSGTNLVISLNKPLPSGEKLTMKTAWSLLIPKTNERNGVIDSTTFFVGYWYPQIAVYDDVFGWDVMNYDFSEEMYNNLGNFDVTLHVPKNFTVLATGELQNPKEVFSAETLKRFNTAKSASETIHIITEDDLNAGFSNKGTDWHFIANEVSDVGFCMSDHYEWDATSLKLGNRSVMINTVFGKGRSGRSGGVTAMQQKAMKIMSEELPGVPYPYPVFTTFIGNRGGGMEYPMMANNGSPARGVTIHEMFHTYFPMYVRINERRFAWMDEGWAEYGEALITQKYLDYSTKPVYETMLPSGPTGTLIDLPLITSTQFMDANNYVYASYPLPAFIYGMLHDALGDEMFQHCLSTYINRWAKKSPTPYDFIYTFENVSGKDLSWLWKPWFFEFGYPDVKVESLTNGKLLVKNLGNKPVPLMIRITRKDGSDTVQYVKADAWSPQREITVDIKRSNDLTLLEINPTIIDINHVNNFFPALPDYTSSFGIDSAITGTYDLDNSETDVTVVFDKGYYSWKTPTSSLIPLLPISKRKLKSTSGRYSFEFTVRNGQPVQVKVEGTGRKALRGTKK